MYKITNVQTRPNTGVSFWTKENPALTAEYLEYYKNTHITTGKHIDFSSSVSDNGLSLTTVIIWDSEASADQWRNDPVVIDGFINLMRSYLDANGITVVKTTETI